MKNHPIRDLMYRAEDKCDNFNTGVVRCSGINYIPGWIRYSYYPSNNSFEPKRIDQEITRQNVFAELNKCSGKIDIFSCPIYFFEKKEVKLETVKFEVTLTFSNRIPNENIIEKFIKHSLDTQLNVLLDITRDNLTEKIEVEKIERC